MMKQQIKYTLDEDRDNSRAPYVVPSVERVDLMLEETLSAGCKLDETACTDPFESEEPTGLAGS